MFFFIDNCNKNSANVINFICFAKGVVEIPFKKNKKIFGSSKKCLYLCNVVFTTKITGNNYFGHGEGFYLFFILLL
jgi:hypothetical protein